MSLTTVFNYGQLFYLLITTFDNSQQLSKWNPWHLTTVVLLHRLLLGSVFQHFTLYRFNYIHSDPSSRRDIRTVTHFR